MAYIAGFLDGDGSVMIQLKNRRKNPRGWRIMFTICFYQDSRHEKPLFWMRKILGIGYISRRKDGITELRINGYDTTRKILNSLEPYLRFKKQQVGILLKILTIIGDKNFVEVSKARRLRIADLIYRSRQLTYQSGWKKFSKSQSELRTILGFD
ncbi:MAG: LAGLIDADG family homing endonuclease [Candidatus Nealsonbacteria bacterium]|nr:LAGLIDADG family homing endonuclease [Candidatus Nealsonbacteria bacterium]